MGKKAGRTQACGEEEKWRGTTKGKHKKVVKRNET